MTEHGKEMLSIAWKALDDKLGEDIRIMDISQVSVLADYFIIAHGNNPNHVKTLADFAEEKLNAAGFPTKTIEGMQGGRNWVLMDFGDIIIHVFGKEERYFYDLERIWADGKIIDKSEIE